MKGQSWSVLGVRFVSILLVPLAAYGAHRAYDDLGVSHRTRHQPTIPVAAPAPLPPAPTEFCGEVLDLNFREGFSFGFLRRLRKLIGEELEECVLYVPADSAERSLLCLKVKGARAPKAILLPLELRTEYVSGTSHILPGYQPQQIVASDSRTAGDNPSN